MMLRRYSSVEDLPAILPVFPLTGAVLLPRGELPLNIFEARYLAMIDAALRGDRLIAMIQPTEHEDTVLTPALSKVGCVGRITTFCETEDGRVLITLTGICRFGVAEELAVKTAYRQIRPDYARFLGDLVADSATDFPRERLLGALKTYLAKRDMKADWRSVMEAPPEILVNALAMLCPFQPAEKQALVEAPGWIERVDTLVAILEMSAAPQPENRSLN
ncbi:MAG TPA: LON peptidase substrate-binding domain-containing protein [Rhizomicrobium sp.]|nr:LON peptidase substrate-binding domain-containing protein [Rhizomicrobium sp.]